MADNFVKRGRLWDTIKVMLKLVEGSLGKQGQPGGAPGPLDGSGHIPLGQMPIDGLNYQGTWDANANSPALTDGSGTAGDFYRVSTAGSQDLGSGVIEFNVGDHVLYEGGVWQSTGGGGVQSVNGDSGPDITITAAELGLTPDNPSALVGPTPATGSAATYMRSDSAPAINLTVAYEWTGTHSFHAGVEMAEQKITNLGDPADPKDAVNKNYVDTTTATAAQGALADTALQPNASPSVVYANNDSGQGEVFAYTVAATAGTFPFRDGSGRIQVASGTASSDAVNYGQLQSRLSDTQRTAIDALTAVATPDASDPASTQTLANANKAAINSIISALQAT